MRKLLGLTIVLGFALHASAQPPDATIFKTGDVPWDTGPENGITLKRFNGNLARINLVRWADGTTAAPHIHATEQILYIQSGRYRVTIEDQVHVLEAGDLIIFPSFLPHGIDALEDSSHIAVFAPAALPPTDSQ